MNREQPRMTALDILQAISSRKLGARENLEAFLARVDSMNPALNAIIHDGRERARATADQIDAALKAGKPCGRLAGLVMTIKDSFNVEGWPSTFGLPRLKDNVPSVSSEIVQCLEEEGALIIGKTNVPPMLRDWHSNNEIHGSTKNPWNTALSPGGSSGGAATAIAAGMCSADVGSDIGGSIRIPAHYCGISGHKPTFGVVPMVGHQFPGTLIAHDLVVAGPLAANVDDLELLFDVIAGPSIRDSRGWRLQLPPPRAQAMADFRVGWIETAETAPVDGAYRDVIGSLVQKIGVAGATVTKGPFDELDTSSFHAVYLQLLRALSADGMADEAYEELIVTASKLDPEDNSYVASTTRAMVQRHRDWRKGREAQAQFQKSMETLFERIDVLLMPVAVSAAFPLGDDRPREERTLLIDGTLRDYNEQLLWAGIPILGYLPSTVVPIGKQADGLPVGIQIMGPYLEDKTCFAFAREVERLVGTLTPPGY